MNEGSLGAFIFSLKWGSTGLPPGKTFGHADRVHQIYGKLLILACLVFSPASYELTVLPSRTYLHEYVFGFFTNPLAEFLFLEFLFGQGFKFVEILRIVGPVRFGTLARRKKWRTCRHRADPE